MRSGTIGLWSSVTATRDGRREVAAENPGRVAGVLLADGALDPGTWPAGMVEGITQSMRDDWDDAIAKGFTPSLALASDEVRAAAFAALEATPRETVIAGFAGMAGHDARATLARYPGRSSASPPR